MSNHIHLLARSQDKLRDFKGFTSRKLKCAESISKNGVFPNKKPLSGYLKGALGITWDFRTGSGT